jgi:hypothetical protein
VSMVEFVTAWAVEAISVNALRQDAF